MSAGGPNSDIDADILFAFARFTFEGKFASDTTSHSDKNVARYTGVTRRPFRTCCDRQLLKQLSSK